MSKRNSKLSKNTHNAKTNAAAREQAMNGVPPSTHPTTEADCPADERRHKRPRLTIPAYAVDDQAADWPRAWNAGDGLRPVAWQEVGDSVGDDCWQQWINLEAYPQDLSEIGMGKAFVHHTQEPSPIAGPSRLPRCSDLGQEVLPLPDGTISFDDPSMNGSVFGGVPAQKMFQTAPENRFVGAANGSMGLHQTMSHDPMLATDPSTSAHWSLNEHSQIWSGLDGRCPSAGPDLYAPQTSNPLLAAGDEFDGSVSSAALGDFATMSRYASIDNSSMWAGAESVFAGEGLDGSGSLAGFESAPHESDDLPSLADYEYAWEMGMLALPSGILAEDDEEAQQDASSEASLDSAGQAPAALGHVVQEDNIYIPPAQSQPSGSASPSIASATRRASTVKRRQTISAGHNKKREDDPLGDLSCDQCDKTDLSGEALRRHKERYHNRFLKNYGEQYPCFLCGDDTLTTSPEYYGRHREGSGVPQCTVMRNFEGDFRKLLKFLIERELARGKDGKGLECLNHWQFSAGRGKYMPALCKEWAAERARRGPLWKALRPTASAHRDNDWDKIPKMGLVLDTEAAAGEPPMKWVKEGVYQPGEEPKVKPPRETKKGKGPKPAKGTKRKRGVE